jgi:hypothetical protein
MAGHEACGFELGQYAIYRGEPDVFVQDQQLLVNVLGAHVPGRTIGQDVEDLETRERDFQTGVSQVIAFIGWRWFEALRHAVPSGMMRADYQSFNGCTPL